MSRADGVLRVVLTGKWFDMIESGGKLEEYRGKHWWRRLLSDSAFEDADGVPQGKSDWYAELVLMSPDRNDFKSYHTLIASRGYTSRTLTRKIKRIRWGAPRPEWSGDTVTGNCFVIELEAPE